MLFHAVFQFICTTRGTSQQQLRQLLLHPTENCENFCQILLTIGEEKQKLECGPMPNLMVALPNIGGALCSTPQSLADAHY